MKHRIFLVKAILLGGGLVVLLALLDRGMALVVDWSKCPAEIVDIQTPSILYAKLEYLRRFPGYKVAMLGDSVVFGRALAEHGDRLWREHNIARLIEERIRREAPKRDVLVMNLALNGALPADVERMEQFVAACGLDLLIFDVGLRSFSSDFSRPEAIYSRSWLAQMSYGPEGRVAIRHSGPSLGQAVEETAAELALQYSALYRFRDLLQYRFLDGPPREAVAAFRVRLDQALGAPAQPTEDDEIVLLLKAQRRFQGVNLAADNPQRQALERLLARLAASRQKALVFYAKEDPARIDNLLEPERYRRLRADLDALVARYMGPALVYLPPLESLQPEDYLDHSHVTYAGYQLLAGAMWDGLRPLVEGVRP
jgi:hypothetical protein